MDEIIRQRLAEDKRRIVWTLGGRSVTVQGASPRVRSAKEISMSRVVEQYQQACQYLAGGVSASIRLNQALGHPLFFDRAEGCRLWDLDGREYFDLCCSHGATLLGHGDPHVRRA